MIGTHADIRRRLRRLFRRLSEPGAQLRGNLDPQGHREWSLGDRPVNRVMVRICREAGLLDCAGFIHRNLHDPPIQIYVLSAQGRLSYLRDTLVEDTAPYDWDRNGAERNAQRCTPD